MKNEEIIARLLELERKVNNLESVNMMIAHKVDKIKITQEAK